MKKLIIVLLGLITVCFSCRQALNAAEQKTPPFQGWFWQNPLPTGNHLNSIKFLNQYTGYAAGLAGTVIKTTDGGIGWTILTTGTETNLNSVFFTSAFNGWAAGEDGKIIFTSDGGETWSTQQSMTSGTIKSLYFINSTTGWAVGYVCFRKTTNGGLNWITDSGAPAAYGPDVVFFSDNNTGWVGGGQGSLYKTSNQGSNWNAVITGISNTVRDIYFKDNNTGWVLFSGNELLVTSNSGIYWIQRYTWSNPTSVRFTSIDTGFVAGIGGTGFITKTYDDGVNWSATMSNITGVIKSLYFYNSYIGWGVGYYGNIVYTLNSGETWAYQSKIATIKSLKSVHFKNSLLGWAVGEEGAIYRTTNGGDTWLVNTSAGNMPLSSVFFVNEYVGYLCGWNSTIMKTTDGGQNWNSPKVIKPFSNSLKSVYFPDVNTGWVVGEQCIFRTLNGGENWINQFLTNDFYAVWFINNSTGWAGGYNGSLYKTTNMGDNWILQTTGTSEQISSIYFINENTGWITASTGVIRKTTNSGSNWFAQNSGTTKNLWAITLTNSQSGWIIADNGLILKTTNSGNNWFAQQRLTGSNLYSVSFVTNDVGWVVGANGTIIKTVTGGAPTHASTISEPMPDRYDIMQNYPNPFNPNTKILYQVPKTSNVKITVYDIRGKLIKTLVNEIMNAGKYKVTFDGSALSSGVYLYVMTAGDFKTTKRMILLK